MRQSRSGSVQVGLARQAWSCSNKLHKDDQKRQTSEIFERIDETFLADSTENVISR